MADDGIKRDAKGQWLPGTKPGPGRPVGSVSFVTAIKRQLEGDPNLEDEVAKRLFKLALDGDHRALYSIKELIDRVDGAVTKRQDINVTGDAKVKVVRLAGDEDDEQADGGVTGRR